MRLLSRYILLEILTFFLVSLSAFTGLLLTVRMLRLTSLIVNRGVDVSQIARVFLAIIPTFLEIALPMATLLGVMLAFARLCGDSEIVVMRASGISLYSFLRPVGIFAATVTVLGLLVSVVLRPWGFSELSRALFDVARSKSISGLSEGVFNKLGAITLYAERIDYATGDLFRVLVDDQRSEQERKIVIARKGRIVADETSQTISLLLGDGTAHELTEGRYSRTDFTSNSLSIDQGELKMESNKGVSARELYVPTLLKAINEYRTVVLSPHDAEVVTIMEEELSRADLLKKYRRAKIEFGQRFSLPMASLIMAFVGMALGITSPRTQRTWGAGFAAALGLVVFISYYSMFSIGLALADSGKLKVWIALWLPNVVTGLVATFLVRKVGSEQWQSVSEGLQRLIERILIKVKRA